MDKYEYKVRLDEIYSLISEGEFGKAVEIADSIDWRRVKSIKTLCTVSDLYKINRRYQESKEILLMAYERYPSGRLIVYSLCELSIKLEEYVQAIEYYKEYVQLAPKDSSRYILQYRLYEAQDVTLEERIAVLEEFKSKDYREKWAYELAYLYHRMGLSSKCVDECDELIVTFGTGKYVIKAMELKALHEPLSQTQQLRYDLWMSEKNGELVVSQPDTSIPEIIKESTSDIPASTDDVDIKGAPTTEMPQEVDIQVKTVDVGQYNTINLQEALAESMKELWSDEESQGEAVEVTPSVPQTEVEDNTIFGTGPLAGDMYADQPVILRPAQDLVQDTVQESAEESVQEPIQEAVQEPAQQVAQELIEETRELPPVELVDIADEKTKRIPTEAVVDYLEAETLKAQMESSTASMQASNAQAEKIPGAVTGKLPPIETETSEYDQMLVQGYDGQISLALAEAEQIEKQITGQLSIDDILASWEETKKENEKKREDEVKQRILQHTGSLFDEFDEDTKAALLAQLEKAFMDAIAKETKSQKDSEELGKKIRREAMRVVEDLAKDSEKGAQVKEDQEIPEVPIEASEEQAQEEIPEETDVVVEEEIDEAPVSEEDEEVADTETSEETIEAVETEDTEADEEEEIEASAEVEAVRQALEEDEEEDKATTLVENTDADVPVDEDGNRILSEEEEELFGAYLTKRSTRKQIINALDNMSMAAYTGNCIVTGEEGVGTMDLAKLLIKQMQSMDSNFVGNQIASIPGKKLNGKNVTEIFDKINGGALIIEHARGMKKSTVESIMKGLENENLGILVILEDTSDGIDRIIAAIPKLADFFNVRIDLKALDDKALVNYACEYAISQEYSIDEFAVLALHTRIEEMQTSDHQVTIAEVRDLVDDAIYYADKKSIGHFFDIILRKRYDDDDMIILREKDFMHY